MKNIAATTLITLSSTLALAHAGHFNSPNLTPVYADLVQLKKLNIPILFKDENTGMAYTMASSEMLNRLSAQAHNEGRCGNFEVLSEIPQNLNSVAADFKAIQTQQSKNHSYEHLALQNINIKENSKISEALSELNANNIKETITWLSSYPNRYNKGADANKHVQDFYTKLKAMTASVAYPVTVEMVTHRNTPQKSMKVSIQGSTRPSEIIVLGGHYDSINGWGFGNAKAPGADDNASGSASLLEALKVLLTKAQPERTVEFMWYAGEESGLLGSAELAESYKTAGKTVIAVLQLDMTSFAGDGANKIASMTDFTSAWLRDYLKAINTTYLNVEILEDQCGYGCSDHASWFRRGYPTLMPTEAKFNSMFKPIHTDRDVISATTSYDHALIFSKIALVLAMDLGNSTQREPVLIRP